MPRVKSLLAPRLGPLGFAYSAYKIWRRIPRRHRRRIIAQTRKHGPRVASVVAGRVRRYRPPRRR
ncbi:MAG: hypothetical protein M3322_01900 [Actinomycetota bacterium]|nr:hypothetical protein [Actinomycetota bacterium]